MVHHQAAFYFKHVLLPIWERQNSESEINNFITLIYSCLSYSVLFHIPSRLTGNNASCCFTHIKILRVIIGNVPQRRCLAACSSCSEQWASSKSAGRAGDRGNPVYQRGPDHVLKKAPSREQRDKLCEQQRRGKETKEETGEQWRSGCDTTAAVADLGGNPKVCWSQGLLSKTHWQKQGPIPTLTFPMLLLWLYIYTPLVKPFPLWIVACTFVFPYLCERALAVILNWIPALFRPFNSQRFLLICRSVPFPQLQ